MHEGPLTPIKKGWGAYVDNQANNEKVIVQSDPDTQDYTLYGQLIMVFEALGNQING